LVPASEPGVHRVLVIGDSFVFGEEVNDEDTFVNLLDVRSEGVRWINAGVPGFGHDQMVLHLERLVGELAVDVVVVGFLACDMNRNLSEFTFWAKPRFLLEEGRWVPPTGEVPTVDELLEQHRLRPMLLAAGEVFLHQLRDPRHADRRARDLSVALMVRLAEVAREAGAEPLFFSGPESRELLDAEPEFVEACRRAEVRCTDTASALRRVAGPVFEEVHWNAAGHAAVADHLDQWLGEAASDGSLEAP